MPTTRNFILYAICAGTLAGCGQTGPLYLPKPPAVPQSATHASPATSTLPVPAAASLPTAATAAAPTPASPPPQRTIR